MINFMLDGKMVELPTIRYAGEVEGGMLLTITDGPHKDTQFTITNIQMDEHDECLLHYDLQPASNLAIREIANNFLVHTLQESVKYFKEQQC